MASAKRGLRQEFQGAEFGDFRLTRRLATIAEAISEAPERSFPRLFEDSSELEAVYRFFGNRKVDPDKILAPHRRESIERCGTKRVVVAHDTTVVSFRAEGKRRGLGAHRDSQQFRIHASLAVSTTNSRDPLGLLASSTFIFDGDGGDGSTVRRWFDQVQTVEQLAGLNAELVHVMDREADDYRTLVDLRKHGYSFVIRAGSERMLAVTPREVPGNVGEAIMRAPIVATREVPITARRKADVAPRSRKKVPPRNARLATLEISAMTMELKRPTQHFDGLLPDACEVNVVRVWEPDAPEGESPVEWILFSSEPIDDTDDVLAIVDAYRARWRIEELFKALKSGCALEQRQLESFESLRNAAATLLPIAWRLLRLRSQTSEAPDAPASTLLDADELKVLRARSRRPLSPEPTRREAILAIAGLGGHLKRNGDPGWQTLGAGLQKLLTLVEGYRLARPARSKGKSGANAIHDQS
jgi:Transposase DNA-binding/Transposase DDE domain